MRILFWLIGFVFFNSCSNLQKNELNDYVFKLKSLENIFNEIEFETFEKASDGFDENMDLIKLLCSDSISLKFVSSVNHYKAIKKSKDLFILNYQLLAKNLELEKNQLQSLEQDIDNNLIPLDSIIVYLNNEKQNLQLMSDETNNVVNLFDEIVIIHDSLYLRIKELAKSNCY